MVTMYFKYTAQISSNRSHFLTAKADKEFVKKFTQARFLKTEFYTKVRKS